MANLRESGGIEPRTRFWPDARQPFVGQRMKESCFTTGRNFMKRGGLVQLGRHRADELVRGDAFADGDLESLADSLADGECDFDRRLSPVRRQIKVALVNAGLLHVRRE